MKNLSHFSPAETLLLIKGKESRMRDVLKYTFMDLLLKQVLEIKHVEKRFARAKPRTYKYVVHGRKFEMHEPAQHEMVFLKPFYKSSSIKIMFQHMIRLAYENSEDESRYFTSIIKSQRCAGYFARNFFQYFTATFSVTKAGAEMGKTLQKELDDLENTLPQVASTDKQLAREMLMAIGGNIFLLKTIDFELMKQVDTQLISAISNSYNFSGCSGGSGGCSSWDSGCSSCSGSGCSGCSGSGCSGCSG